VVVIPAESLDGVLDEAAKFDPKTVKLLSKFVTKGKRRRMVEVRQPMAGRFTGAS
jgi:hypothetical protein